VRDRTAPGWMVNEFFSLCYQVPGTASVRDSICSWRTLYSIIEYKPLPPPHHPPRTGDPSPWCRRVLYTRSTPMSMISHQCRCRCATAVAWKPEGGADSGGVNILAHALEHTRPLARASYTEWTRSECCDVSRNSKMLSRTNGSY
jgi:hypothetical protein